MSSVMFLLVTVNRQVRLPVKPPEELLLLVSMTTEHGLYFEDVLPVHIERVPRIHLTCGLVGVRWD